MYQNPYGGGLFPEDHREIEKDFAKNFNRKELQIAYDEARELHRQRVAEKKKSQCEEIALRADGTFQVFTQNLDVACIRRKLCNFVAPKLTRLFSRKDSEECFCLECKAEGKDKKIYLKKSKAGEPKYFLRKLNEQGCEIYATSRRLQEEYASKIWTQLVNLCTLECEIPDDFGWRTSSDGKMEFVDLNRIIWEEVTRWTK